MAVALAAASGCDSSSCDEDEIELLVSSSTAEPGQIRTAIRFGFDYPVVAVRPEGGVVCLACSELQRLDADLREEGRIGSMKEPMNLVVGPDGTTYALVQLSGEYVYEVIALDAAGERRWRTRLEGRPLSSLPGALAADAARVYVGGSSLIVLDAASGVESWSSPLRQLGVSHDGVFVAQKDAVVHLDRTGAEIWTRPMEGPNEFFTDAVVTPDGGAIVVGRVEASLDLGDRKLEDPSGRQFYFIVELAPTGAVRWAYKLDDMSVGHVALTERGEILLAGGLPRERGAASADAFLAVATSQGVVRTHRIGGIGYQSIDDLQVSPDGATWLQVANKRDSLFGEHDAPDPTIEVGPHQLHGYGNFLLGVVR